MKLVLGLIDFELLLIFGIFVTLLFAGVDKSKRNIIGITALCLMCSLFQLISYLVLGMDTTILIYPFIVHLPLMLMLVFFFKLGWLPSIFSMTSAYLYCHISKWLSLLVKTLTGSQILYYAVHILSTLLLGFIILKYVLISVRAVLQKSNRSVLIFSILPISYYLFDFFTTVYSDVLYRGDLVVIEFLPFGLAVAFMIFCILYFQEYEETCESEWQKHIMEIQAEQSLKYIESQRRAEYESRLLRHDIRHHFRSIYSYIDNGEPEKAKQYINEFISFSDNVAVQLYCKNQLVNMVLSSYSDQVKDAGIRLNIKTSIPETLPCPELDFSCILSNGLENAINAVTSLPANKNYVDVNISMFNGKLLLSITNPCGDMPVIIDGLPISSKHGHGFGTQSIRHLAERMGGKCLFSANDGIFSLMVII